jgi:hypothetical protein
MAARRNAMGCEKNGICHIFGKNWFVVANLGAIE